MTDLERDLAELGARLERSDIDVWPAVSRSVAHPPRRMLSPLAVAAGVAVLAASLLFVEPVRSTVAAWLGIGQTSVEVVPGLDPGIRTSVVGEPVSKEQATRVLGRAPRLPVGLDDPDGWVQTEDSVLAVWAPSDALPEIGTSGAGLILSESVADAGQSVKQIGTVDGAVFVETDDLFGIWIEGPHVLIPPSGDPESVGSVLIWVEDGIQFRLESALAQGRVVEIASGVR